MGFQHVLQLQVGIAQHMYAALAIGQEEQVAGIVPGDLVHLKVELLFGPDLVRSRVDERDQILFVADSNGVAVGRPRYVDVFAFGVHNGRAFAGAGVPYPNRFVAAGRAQ